MATSSIAAITSCTNTSNPSVLIAAGLVARKAREKGLQPQAVGQDQPRAGKPGGHRLSRTRAGLSEDLERARLRPRRLWLHHLHRQFGPAAPSRSARRSTTTTWSRVSVLSGNRNFEGRVSPDCRANYLASPPLVVAYALKGTVRSDMVNEPIGTGAQRRAGVPQGHLADERGDPRADRRARPFATCSAAAMPTSIAATSAGGRSRSTGGDDLRLAGRIDLHPEPALLRRA